MDTESKHLNNNKMKDITLIAHCSLGMEKRQEELTIEVDDDASPEQIEEEKEFAAREWAFNEFSYTYWDKEVNNGQ